MTAPDPNKIDPIARLSALDKKLDPAPAREEYTILKPALLDLYRDSKSDVKRIV